MRPDGFYMTASVTTVIMSARGLVPEGLLCRPHSPHSHLHFHWQPFSPHKKFNTPICEPCSANEKWRTGSESSHFKSQLIVPVLREGPRGFEAPTSVHLSPQDVIQRPHGLKCIQVSLLQGFWPSMEILYFILW